MIHFFMVCMVNFSFLRFKIFKVFLKLLLFLFEIIFDIRRNELVVMLVYFAIESFIRKSLLNIFFISFFHIPKILGELFH